MASAPIQPLDRNIAIVDANGNPTDYFIRWAQQQVPGGGGGDGITLAQLEDYLAAHTLQEGSGIQITPDGNLTNSPTIDADAQEILDQISTTRGTLLYRGLGGWSALVPGTSGYFLKTNGAGADPAWAAAIDLLPLDNIWTGYNIFTNPSGMVVSDGGYGTIYVGGTGGGGFGFLSGNPIIGPATEVARVISDNVGALFYGAHGEHVFGDYSTGTPWMTLTAAGAAVAGYVTVTDEAYGAGWDGSVQVPTKNAIYDKIEAVIASIPAAPSTVISDTIYGSSWDGVTTIAPSKNAVYDKIESVVASIDGGKKIWWFNPPPSATFGTTVTEGSATNTAYANDNDIGLVLKAQVPTDNLYAKLTAAPAFPFTITAHFTMTSAASYICGIVLRASGTGLRTVFGRAESDAGTLVVRKATGTTFNAQLGGSAASDYFGHWFRIVVTSATNIEYYASEDGKNWILWQSNTGNGQVAGLNQIGIGITGQGNPALPVYINCDYWSVV